MLDRVLNTSLNLIYTVLLMVFLWIVFCHAIQTVQLESVSFIVTSCFFYILGKKPEKPEKAKTDFPQLIGK